ncbi:hypothetical protein ABK040_004441 [Willaertia magna]
MAEKLFGGGNDFDLFQQQFKPTTLIGTNSNEEETESTSKKNEKPPTLLNFPSTFSTISPITTPINTEQQKSSGSTTSSVLFTFKPKENTENKPSAFDSSKFISSNTVGSLSSTPSVGGFSFSASSLTKPTTSSVGGFSFPTENKSTSESKEIASTFAPSSSTSNLFGGFGSSTTNSSTNNNLLFNKPITTTTQSSSNAPFSFGSQQTSTISSLPLFNTTFTTNKSLDTRNVDEEEEKSFEDEEMPNESIPVNNTMEEDDEDNNPLNLVQEFDEEDLNLANEEEMKSDSMEEEEEEEEEEENTITATSVNPINNPELYNRNWWKIIHESFEMFLYIQQCFDTNKLSPQILEKCIYQFKSILYQGVLNEMEGFINYYEIFSAIEIFYFNRVWKGSILQKLIQWYLKSTFYLNKNKSINEDDDKELYQLLIIGESSDKVMITINDKKKKQLKILKDFKSKLFDYFIAFLDLLNQRPNIIHYKSIRSIYDEYLDEITNWKRLALKFKKEFLSLSKNFQDEDEKEVYKFISNCLNILTGNEETIFEHSNNWIEAMIGLLLYKYQHFNAISETIDLGVLVSERFSEMDDGDNDVLMSAIRLVVIQPKVDDTLKYINQCLTKEENFGCFWFMTHVHDFVLHILNLQKHLFNDNNTLLALETIKKQRSYSISDYVEKELIPFYLKQYEFYGSNDCWKIGIEYLTYSFNDDMTNIEIMKRVLDNVKIKTENELESVERYIKGTPFAEEIGNKLHIQLGDSYKETGNYAAAVYHYHFSNDNDKLQTFIEQISDVDLLRKVYYGLEEYNNILNLKNLQWIHLFFKILNHKEKYINQLSDTLHNIPNEELKIYLLQSCREYFKQLEMNQIIAIMEHVEEMEYKVIDTGKNNSLLNYLNECRYLLAQFLQTSFLSDLVY